MSRIRVLRMVLHAVHRSVPYILSLKPASLAVSIADTRVVSWDRGGRLYSVYDAGTTVRRGLSGQVLEKTQDGPVRTRRVMPGAAADAVIDAAARTARKTLDAIESGAWTWTGPVDGVVAQELRTLLRLCAQFDAAAAGADARLFAAVYRPVGILPPDQYLSLVVQATEGCSFNSCTFCDLYHDGYRVKTIGEFRAHIAAVRTYLGESIGLRGRGIFLGAANALAVPMARLLPMFEVLAEEMDSIRRGVCAFVDGFTGTLKQASDYRALRHLGLRRVYVGLESGHDPLLALVRKPATAAGAIDTVHAIRMAGVPVGVIVMIGLGGDAYADAHVRDTIATLNAMALGDGDLLYFSDLVEVPGTTYPRIAEDQALQPLSAAERRAQQHAIRDGLRPAGRPPQSAVYDIREFVY